MYSNGEPAHNGSWYSGKFNRCWNLTEIKEGCELSKTMRSTMGMFEYNYKLKSVPESFKLPNGLISTAFMFHGCKELDTLNFKKFPLPKSVKDVGNMFAYCDKLYRGIILWKEITSLCLLRSIIHSQC